MTEATAAEAAEPESEKRTVHIDGDARALEYLLDEHTRLGERIEAERNARTMATGFGLFGVFAGIDSFVDLFQDDRPWSDGVGLALSVFMIAASLWWRRTAIRSATAQRATISALWEETPMKLRGL